MSCEVHVRFCESLWVRFPWATLPSRPKKSGGDPESDPRFSVDDCGQNSRLLSVFKSLGVEDLTQVITHHADSAGLPLSPPLFFGLAVIRVSDRVGDPLENARNLFAFDFRSAVEDRGKVRLSRRVPSKLDCVEYFINLSMNHSWIIKSSGPWSSSLLWISLRGNHVQMKSNDQICTRT